MKALVKSQSPRIDLVQTKQVAAVPCRLNDALFVNVTLGIMLQNPGIQTG